MSIYAASDFHGCLDLYQKIKASLKPEDEVYYLGDAGDRGRQPWETLKAVFEDPQFIYILGNHDVMLYNAINHHCLKNSHGIDYQLLCQNGGKTTFYDCLNDSKNKEILDSLITCPYWAAYDNKNNQTIYLSHAGFTPQAEFIREDKYIEIPESEDLIWDRNHINDEWPKEMDNVYIIHGHTPTRYIDPSKSVGPLFYADGHKIAIDNASAASNCATLLNLDTFEYQIFSSLWD